MTNTDEDGLKNQGAENPLKTTGLLVVWPQRWKLKVMNSLYSKAMV